jgi:hypothetical protein
MAKSRAPPNLRRAFTQTLAAIEKTNSLREAISDMRPAHASRGQVFDLREQSLMKFYARIEAQPALQILQS